MANVVYIQESSSSKDCLALKDEVETLKENGNKQDADQLIKENRLCFEGTKHWENIEGPKLRKLDDDPFDTGAHSEFCKNVRHNYAEYKKNGMDAEAQSLVDDYPDCEPKLGYQPPNPKLDARPGSMEFGQIKAGATNTIPITLRNTGSDADLDLQSLSFSGPHADLFHLEKGSLGTLPPDEQTKIWIQFAPEEIGRKTATLTIESNDNRSPLKVSLDGGIKRDEPDEDVETTSDAEGGEQQIEDVNSDKLDSNSKECKETFDECIPEVLEDLEEKAQRTVASFEKFIENSGDKLSNLEDKINKRLEEFNECLKENASEDYAEEKSVKQMDNAESPFKESLNPLEKYAENQLGNISDFTSDPSESNPLKDLKILHGVAQGLFPGLRAVKAADQIQDAMDERDSVFEQIETVQNQMDKSPAIMEDLVGTNPQQEQATIDLVQESVAACRECVDRTHQRAIEDRRENPDEFRPKNEFGEPTTDSSKMDVKKTTEQTRHDPTMENIADVLGSGREALDMKPNKASDQMDNLRGNINNTISAMDRVRNTIKDLKKNMESMAKDSAPSSFQLAEQYSSDEIGLDKKLNDLEKTLENTGPENKQSAREQMRNIEQGVRALANTADNTLSDVCGAVGEVNKTVETLEQNYQDLEDKTEDLLSNANDSFWSQLAECQRNLNKRLDETAEKDGEITKEDASLLQGSVACIRNMMNKFWEKTKNLFSGMYDSFMGLFEEEEEKEKTKSLWDSIKSYASSLGKKIYKKAKEGIQGLWGELEECTTALDKCIREQLAEEEDTTEGSIEANQTSEKLRREQARRQHLAKNSDEKKKKGEASMKRYYKNIKELGGNLRKMRERVA